MSVQNPTTNPNPNGIAVSVGLVNQLVCPPVQTSGGIIFINPSQTVSVAVCPASQMIIASGTAPATPGALNVPPAGISGPIAGVAAINGAGSITLAPGDKFILDNIQATSAWNGIASGPGGVLTVLVF